MSSEYGPSWSTPTDEPISAASMKDSGGGNGGVRGDGGGFTQGTAWRVLVWTVTLALLAVNIWLQRPELQTDADLEKARAGLTDDDAMPMDITSLVGKFGALLRNLAGTDAERAAASDQFRQILDAVDQQLEPIASAEDNFRMALLSRRLVSDADSRRRLETLDEQLDPESPLRQDLSTANAILDGDPAVTDEARAEILEKHGLAGKLFASEGDALDLLMQESADAGAVLLLIFGSLGLLVLLALLAGVVLIIVGIVKLSSGGLRSSYAHYAARFDGAPHPSGRTVWLETLAVFLLGFLILKGVSALAVSLAQEGDVWPIYVTLLGQWTLVFTVLWPLVRGMSWEEFRGRLGWHSGRGVFREIGAGLAAYLATLPVYFLAAFIGAIASAIWEKISGHKTRLPVENKIGEIAAQGGLIAVLLGTLVVAWAPIVEEAIFRGATFNAARRAGPVLAVLFSATMFAALHSYMLVQLALVAVLGISFALMREWRSSLIGSMTAHALHNATVFLVMLAAAHFASS